ncbi:unnamed protein product [Acanthoscelides obtectus]|uniref:Uncharacterized protein n=1 Tax=Acanthoscelides obtectus TaxID=200917 RepID=A0A9P0PH72_ACAOB|nr:unnamed protein product [Acanthoscelides obtectus]CAK1623455.1 Glutathione S-transferase 1 [Acanthoscelides obtectus]
MVSSCSVCVKMTLTLYYIEASPPVRTTLMAIKALGLQVETKRVDLPGGEHLKPEYLKINPLHTVPTLVDGDFIVWDSHAINCYLVDKYAKDDSLYPKDLQKRAIVNQRLFFECEVLFNQSFTVLAAILRHGAKSVTKEHEDKVLSGYESLEKLLKLSPFLAGNSVTIADFSAVTTVTSSSILIPIVASKFPKIAAWIKKMETLPYYKEGNQEGLDILDKYVKDKIASN